MQITMVIALNKSKSYSHVTEDSEVKEIYKLEGEQLYGQDI